MKRIIKNVEHVYADGAYSVFYRRRASKDRHDTVSVTYSQENLPKDVGMWMDSELILKTADIGNSVSRSIVGSFRTTEDGGPDYIYSSSLKNEDILVFGNEDGGEYFIATGNAVARALEAARTGGNTGAPWISESAAGLCELCHRGEVNARDVFKLLPEADVILSNI